MRCRDAAKKKAIKTKNPHDWANYRKLRNKINNNVKTTKASVMFSGKQTTARKMADQLRTILIKEHMGFTITAYILQAQYELLTL